MANVNRIGQLSKLLKNSAAGYTKVGNVPATATRADLVNLFSKYGVNGSDCLKILRSRFGSEEWIVGRLDEKSAVESLVHLQGAMIGGQKVRLSPTTDQELEQIASSQALVDPDAASRSLFVKGLKHIDPASINRQMRALFEGYSLERLSYDLDRKIVLIIFGSENQARIAHRNLNGAYVECSMIRLEEV
mmetsp:Transcript_10391/g.43231  ORF Transcript_10391/g.43231 Transcript_10391/m.43231 type:complete len:190 (-) Transcript_10391:1537-2106(-)|eukprot:CAMPEP_0113964556 /NCGR_PEP_ID=MMETSP0011_2-20120614/7218_1 /TAXON_ID=101924 /ORGANISM="Rhodosorus marinus" /LENGTH=189 /DNA_ID=CAMNT_0000976897 /DNA_START=99 /DNA_END=668 /DNA_ORIENTATION=- /assembly_acc=CAM_ASM_000156